MSFDLLKAQLDACAEIGVRAPVYVSAGFDEKEVAEHPEWLYWGSPEGPSKEYLEAACYHLLCYNTSYLDFLAAQVEEVMERYNPCEIFLIFQMSASAIALTAGRKCWSMERIRKIRRIFADRASGFMPGTVSG